MNSLYYNTDDARTGLVEAVVALGDVDYARVRWVDDNTVTFEDVAYLAENATFFSSLAEATAAAQTAAA